MTGQTGLTAMNRVTAILLSAAVLVILPQAAGAAPTLQCKSNFEVGTAPGQPTIPVGTHFAREAWKLSVRARFGPAWSDPLFAKNTTHNCTQQPTVLGAVLFLCVYRARPCKP